MQQAPSNITAHDFQVDADFLADVDQVVLRCEGLDTVATVAVNGQTVIKADNMFRTWEADVKSMLKTGVNTIIVTFTNCVQKCEEGFAKKALPSWNCFSPLDIIDFKSGTVKELQGKRHADGSISFHFGGFKLPKYGSAMDGNWEFGVYDRSVEGDTKHPFHLPDRVMPGSPAVMTIAKTPQGPVPMLNGKPFYFNVLTLHHFNVPNGIEGPKSPFNVVVVRAGGYGDSGRWWVGPDQYDFSVVDANLSMLAERFPDSMLGLFTIHGRSLATMFSSQTTGIFASFQMLGTQVLPGNSCPCSVKFAWPAS